jgi:hypothetical protein
MMTERRERTVELLRNIIQYNKTRRDRYYELSLDIQNNYGLNDYIDLHAQLENYGTILGENEERVYEVSDNEFEQIEQALIQTASLSDFLCNWQGIIKTEPVLCQTEWRTG